MNAQTNLYLKGEFILGPSFKTKYTVSLTSNSISYVAISTKTNEEISFDDVIGATVSQNSTENEIASAFIHIFSYPLKKRGFSGVAARHRVEHVFEVSGEDSSDQNLELAEKWVRCIRWLLAKNCDVNLAIKHEDNPPKQHYLIFINPFGGKGTAMSLFENEVKPMLEEADVQYDLKVTEHMGHAREIIQNMENLDKFSCIVCCSGDGIINEVINGLMSRPDWQEAIKISLGHIPCGSGNGLCASSLHHAGEPFDMISSVFTVVKGKEWPLDILKAQMSKPEPHYSFLSIVYGIVADVDIESERFRYLGDIRFSIMGVKKIIEKAVFSGKLSYIPVNDDNSSNSNETVPNGATKCKQHSCKKEENFEDYGNLNDGNVVNDKTSNLKMTDKGLYNGNVKHCATNNSELLSNDKLPDIANGKVTDGREDRKVKGGNLVDGTKISDGNITSGILESCTTNKFMPNFNEPIPESWKEIEGDFVGILFISASHIGKDTFCAPEKQFGDGIIHCLVLNGDITRRDLISVLMRLESGTHVDVHGVSMLKARALRFEPYSASSKIITIDGERFEWDKLQAEVYKGLGRVRCRGPADSTNRNDEEQ